MFFVLSTHLEGNTRDNADQAAYNADVALLETAFSAAEAHGATIDVGCGTNFAVAEQRWGKFVLAEAVARGHQVSTHADIPALKTTPAALLTELRRQKAAVDALVGAENDLGVSGLQGPFDWIGAARDAGFSWVSGLTGLAYLSMPVSARPPGWSDAYIRKTAFHFPAPVDLDARVHPVFVSDARDFVADPNGTVLVDSGELGTLSSLAEGGSCTTCKLDAADITALGLQIEAALALDDGSPSVVALQVPLPLFGGKNAALLGQALDLVGTYVDQGRLQWGTRMDAFDAARGENLMSSPKSTPGPTEPPG